MKKVLLLTMVMSLLGCSLIGDYEVSINNNLYKEARVMSFTNELPSSTVAKNSDYYNYLFEVLKKHQGTWQSQPNENKGKNLVAIGLVPENIATEYVNFWIGSNYIGVGYQDSKNTAGDKDFFKMIPEQEIKDILKILNTKSTR